MLVELNTKGYFDLERVNSLLPVIVKITASYKNKVENKMLLLEQIASSKMETIESLEAEIDTMIAEWKAKMERLGAKPAGLWALDFDNQEGYYCWKYPEEEVLYWHGYKEGYTNRKRINESVLPF